LAYGSPDGYKISEKGKTLRHEAEDKTDAYFYNPWDYLSEGELGDLSKLLEKLKSTLEGLAPKDE